jgi:hypothetical protein
MPHTHKKKFKNRGNENDTSSKFKRKKRNVKSMMNQIIGGVLPDNSGINSNSDVGNSEGVRRYDSTDSGVGVGEGVRRYDSTDSGVGVGDSSLVELNTTSIIHNQENKDVVSTNTSFSKSNLKSNPFYAKKSTHLVENKKMYSFDTNYILAEIEKRRSSEPNFMITSELITEILANKPESTQIAHEKQQQTKNHQQKLHQDLCDFD